MKPIANMLMLESIGWHPHWKRPRLRPVFLFRPHSHYHFSLLIQARRQVVKVVLFSRTCQTNIKTSTSLTIITIITIVITINSWRLSCHYLQSLTPPFHHLLRWHYTVNCCHFSNSSSSNNNTKHNDNRSSEYQMKNMRTKYTYNYHQIHHKVICLHLATLIIIIIIMVQLITSCTRQMLFVPRSQRRNRRRVRYLPLNQPQSHVNVKSHKLVRVMVITTTTTTITMILFQSNWCSLQLLQIHKTMTRSRQRWQIPSGYNFHRVR